MTHQYSVNHDDIGKESDSIELRKTYELNKVMITNKLKSLNAIIIFMTNGDIVFTSDKSLAEIKKVLLDNNLKVNNRNQSKQVYTKFDTNGNEIIENVENHIK
tara:strand:- start:63 stop:371 length:309 start_codon:yes stop_codon:yes gene_type:complete